MKRFKVALVSTGGHPIPDWVYKRFEDENIEFVVNDCETRKDLEKIAKDADVLFITSSRKGLICEENMDIFKKAGCAIKCGSGTDNIDAEACTKRGIIVAHTPDDPTEPTSDHFIAMLLTAIRQTARQDRMVRKGIWSATDALPLGTITGEDLGIIGFGRIGKAIVKKMSGFDMTVRIYDPYIDKETIQKNKCLKVTLEELLKKSKYVMVACPLLKETKGLIGEKELRMMREDAVIVNVARAGIVDETALRKALKQKWIKAAALDVIEKYPLLPGDEWLEFENINFTPHLGGYSGVYPDGIYINTVEVIVGLSKGKMPEWIVNRQCKPKWDLK